MADDIDEDGIMSDKDLAQVLVGRAEQLADGEISREEVLGDLLKIVARESQGTITRAGETIGTRGRVSFGRGRSGGHGTAVFVPEDVLDPDELDDAQGEA